MAQTYFAILTAIGEAKLANAAALGTSLQLTKMGVGDGNGATPIPSRTQTALVYENRRALLNQLSIDPANPSQIIAEQIIPEDIGGWWIRELGLYDNDGNLCAVANCPDTYKPVLASGSGRTQIIRMVLIVANASAVELKIDPSIVLAPRAYVDQVMTVHQQDADPHPQYAKDADLAYHVNAADPHPQYSTETEVADQIKTSSALVRVKDYVAGDDHAPGFLAAIQLAAQTNRRVDISGNWTFKTKCDASGYDVRLSGAAIIDAAMVPAADPALILGGKLGNSAPLGANAALGAAGVVCALQPQPGDIIKLESTEAWSTERAYYTKGELCRVLAAVGGTIYLQTPLQDSYTAATTTVTLLQAANVAIDHGLNLKRNADSPGLIIQYARDPAITRPSVIQARERCISMKESIGGYINLGFALADMPAGGSQGTNYGLVLESCADTTINGGNYRGGRHGIATGGTFPCRDLKFSKCIVDNDHTSTVYSLDAHANGERFVYEDVFNKNGAVIQAIDCVLRGGNWQTVNINACLSLFPARSVTRYRVEGIWCYNTQAGGKGLTYSNAVSGINMGSLFVESSRLVADIPLQVLPRVADTQFDTISVDERSTLQAMGLTAGSGSFIYNNDVVNPLIKRVIIKAKLLAGSLGKALVVTSNAKTFDYVEVSGTSLEHSANDNAVLIQRAKVARFTGNQCAGFGVSLRVELASCDRTITGGNQFSGFTSVGGLYLNGNTENIKLGGDYSDASSGISPGPVFVTYMINERGNKVTYGPTAPTSGAWRVGDICINNTPGGASGWVYGWECTTAGSQGTWKVIATLS